MAEPLHTPRRRFFDVNAPREGDVLPDGGVRAEAVSYDHPRAVAASATVLDPRNRDVHASMSRSHAWHDAAWGYSGQVVELKFAFYLIALVVSRAILYSAVVENSSEVPVEARASLSKVD